MERSSKRGKIPQQDWPSIIKRYEAGETLASIARTYDCSPPAISYILSRSRAREPTPENTSELSELAVVKPQPSETPAPRAAQEGRGVDAKLGGSVEPGGSDPAPRLSIREQPTEGEQPGSRWLARRIPATKRGSIRWQRHGRSIDPKYHPTAAFRTRTRSGNFGSRPGPAKWRSAAYPAPFDVAMTPAPRSESGLREGLSQPPVSKQRFAARSAGDLKPDVSQPDRPGRPRVRLSA